MRPGQVFSNEYDRILAIFIVFQDLPGRLAEIGRVADINLVGLAQGGGGPKQGAGKCNQVSHDGKFMRS